MKTKARRSGTETDGWLYRLCWAIIAGVIIYLVLRLAGVV